MKQTNPPPKSRRTGWMKTYLPILLSVVSLALNVVLGCRQIAFAQVQTEMGKIFSPITYQVYESDATFTYQFSGQKLTRGYPCVRFTNGRPKEVAAIVYSSAKNKLIVTGTAVQTTDEIVIQDIKTEMPRDEFDAGARYAYDYFFLYFTDSSGVSQLALLYYQIDLQQNVVSECSIAVKPELLLLDEEQTDPYRREMLIDYKMLLAKIDDLNSMI